MSAVPMSGQAVECERCGRAFGCGAADERCWCAEVELSATTRRTLAAAHRGCLCPACLAEIAAAPGGGD